MGCCKGCGCWNTLSESIKQEKIPSSTVKALSLKEVSETIFSRYPSNLSEFDRLVGGGIVKGSVLLIGGAPGIGKSTLLLQLADQFSSIGTILYICAEESESQTSLRAKRLGIASDNLLLLHATSLLDIRQQIEQCLPKIVIIDSLQLLVHPDITSSAGSLVQVREIAHALTQIAKQKGITLFLVTHVTKTGEIAGPKVVEHIVDVVLEFEGDKQHGFRILRSLKNRFGPTHEIALFDMQEKGLAQVSNPSSYFLSERAINSSGCTASCVKEGGRFFLLEVQALVTPTFFPSPSRKAAGVDGNRLALLLAVLEKRVGYSLHNCDVFVSITGGLKVSEPAVDLSILMAIASSFTNKAIDSKTLILGEVGLAGEVRSISQLESRLKEGVQMGFTVVIIPKHAMHHISHLKDKIEIKGVKWVEEAIDYLL